MRDALQEASQCLARGQEHCLPEEEGAEPFLSPTLLPPAFIRQDGRRRCSLPHHATAAGVQSPALLLLFLPALLQPWSTTEAGGDELSCTASVSHRHRERGWVQHRGC